MTKTEQQENEWISASVALNQLLADGIGPSEAMDTLAAFLRLGKIRARAEKIWISEEVSLSAAWRNIPDDAETDTEIPTRFFRSHKNWADDVANWRWPVSNLHVTTNLKPRKRRMMRRVSLSLADLVEVQPRHFATTNKRKRGPRRDDSRRDLVWLELFTMGLKEDFAGLESQGDLEGILYDRLNPEGSVTRVGKNIITEAV